METVVGFFGRLEYVTSGEAAFTKTTEFVRQARNVTDRCTQRPREDQRNSISMEATACVEDGSRMQVEHHSPHRHGAPVPQGESGQIREMTPPPSESLRSEEISDTQSNYREMSIIPHDQSLYSELAGLLATPAGDTMQANWLGDWVSAV